MTHDQYAKRVREHKEKNPEKYCKAGKCLWRLKQGEGPYCPKHTAVVNKAFEVFSRGVV